MGQAVAVLPNPLAAPAPPAGASLSGTDDLLAQLAGDEIDRLLAEADVPRTPPAAAARAAPAPSPPAAVPAPVAASPAQGEAAPAPAAAALGDELDTLLNELTSGAPASPARPRTLTEQVPEVLAQLGGAPGAATPAGSESLEGVMSLEERDALSLSNLDAAAAAAEQQDAAAAAAAVAAARPSIPAAADVEKPSALFAGNLGVRFLELINVPLAFVPDRARDTLGKAAIVTIVNSVAVLIYVLFLRH
jgi:hypothetical protein